MNSSVQRLHFWLGWFTNLYLAAIAAEFFSNLHLVYPLPERLLAAFAEPYLGALAVYVVLKELRKHRDGPRPHRRGEWFVIAWLALLVVTTAAVAFTELYRFDTAYQLVIQNSLASLLIYIGSRIHKP